VQSITKTKLGILLYRRNVKIRECLQYPEQTASILSRSGTKHIKEGKCSQPARAAYPNNRNDKSEDGDPLHRSFITWWLPTSPLQQSLKLYDWITIPPALHVLIRLEKNQIYLHSTHPSVATLVQALKQVYSEFCKTLG